MPCKNSKQSRLLNVFNFMFPYFTLIDFFSQETKKSLSFISADAKKEEKKRSIYTAQSKAMEKREEKCRNRTTFRRVESSKKKAYGQVSGLSL